ncbi:carbohydrate ABC transporter permease [Pullulanibacillus sp. KACC 23026]|uniref:carbohydrate ABC transporter permease n=1 Tax=Pullulanibacillus sp. KACC 23026 TaxID=3028315 RepID=UPI0023B16B59|nr:carbohydrate ABC transporter permease [Pullulanibacillus sp. KACC 23026]WEG13372.1 carbohydrate ABC transporter permease [Pullulanibacillus sp. KACC 23026]
MVGSKQRGVPIRYLIATILLVVMVFPYIYMVLSSFAVWDQVDQKLIPTHYTLKSYEWLLSGGQGVTPMPWIHSFFNSLIVTAASTFLMMLFGVMVAYALSKMQFKGRKTIDNIILFQMFFPALILLIPTFLVVEKMGLFNSYLGMILPKAVSLWAIFMYTNFFKAIPDTYIEAAQLDGASTWKIIFKIVLPMSKSITTVIFLFLFMERWTELLWDMIITNGDKMQTLNVLLSQMFGPYGQYPGPMYAAGVLLTFPIIIIFLIFSKQFKEGMQFTLK